MQTPARRPSLRATLLIPLALGVLFDATRAAAQSVGQRLFAAHCARCHNLDGSGGEGPSLTAPTLPSVADDESLATVIRNGIPGTEMPGNYMLGDEEVAAVVAYVRSLSRVAPDPVSGDPARGRQLFEGKGACGVCHVIDGIGGAIGPDLSGIGSVRGPSHLRQSLLAPGESVSYRYLVVEARAEDGRAVEGMRVNEDTFTIQLRDANGVFHSFDKRSLGTLEKKFGASLMPGYAETLDEREVEDLVAFLAERRAGR